MNAIDTFFSAWSISDDGDRKRAIAASVSTVGTYIDPRSQGVLTGPDAIAGYVALFHSQAPGWTANVVKSDVAGTCTRVTTAFAGTGPDGSAVVQHGQYFIEIEEGFITRIVGFVGTGAVG